MTTATVEGTTGAGHAPVPARPRTFSPPELAFLVGVPLLWGILLLFHPVGDDFYATIEDHLTRWLTVHLGSMLFIPLMAGVMFLLLRGIDGTAAWVGRVALAVFAVVYLVFEAVVGIGAGLLVDNLSGPASERADVVDDYMDSQILTVLETLGSAGWIVAAIAAAVALSPRADGRRSVAVVLLLVLSAVPITFHVTPFGPVGLAMFIAAILLVARDRSAAGAARPLGEPRIA
jgi:hypothetical protein